MIKLYFLLFKRVPVLFKKVCIICRIQNDLIYIKIIPFRLKVWIRFGINIFAWPHRRRDAYNISWLSILRIGRRGRALLHIWKYWIFNQAKCIDSNLRIQAFKSTSITWIPSFVSSLVLSCNMFWLEMLGYLFCHNYVILNFSRLVDSIIFLSSAQ